MEKPMEKPMTDWKTKAMKATAGSRFGAVLAAALGAKITAPCFCGKASVTSDGYVMASFTSADGSYHMGAFVGSAADLVRNTLGLAKHLQLNAADRDELYATVRSWVAADYSSGKALADLRLKVTVH
jgi:hypothetical protein